MNHALRFMQSVTDPPWPLVHAALQHTHLVPIYDRTSGRYVIVTLYAELSNMRSRSECFCTRVIVIGLWVRTRTLVWQYHVSRNLSY